MNIKNNIRNYLFDKEYCICSYENNVYVYKYNYLESFNDKRITLKLESKIISVNGLNLRIMKITKDEILIHGEIKSIEMTRL